MRLNRLFVKAEHRDNPGGAVADRNAALEKKTIKRLRAKWPGVFLDHRRKLEVTMRWSCRKPFLGFRVAKRFDGELFCGEVTKFLPAAATTATPGPTLAAAAAAAAAARSDDASAASVPPSVATDGGDSGSSGGGSGAEGGGEDGDLWDIDYDDGDYEQLNLEELKAAIQLHRETQGNDPTEVEAAQSFYQ